MQSTATPEKVVLEIVRKDIPKLKDNEVLVRVEAAPINPSDVATLLAFADPTTCVTTGTDGCAQSTMDVPAKFKGAIRGREGTPTPVGNEGAGVVTEAGSSAEAQALLGKTVAVMGGGMYAQYRKVRAGDCLVLPKGITPSQGAACFVNPLTVLGFIETMKMEGHTGLVHTAAASNLGQMLLKVCLRDNIPLVNIVRKADQEELLRGLGATHVIRSDKPTFIKDLAEALKETKATLAFDAIGGGETVGQILTAMEIAAGGVGVYGSTVYKQVYIYGGLDRSPTTFNRSFGMMWGIGGWLMPNFAAKIGTARMAALREQVANEITTTFASKFAHEVSLLEAVQAGNIKGWASQATGQKYLVNPHKKIGSHL